MKKRRLTRLLRNVPPKKIEKFRWKIAYKEALLGIALLYIPISPSTDQARTPTNNPTFAYHQPLIRDDSYEKLQNHLNEMHKEIDYTF